MVTWNLGNSGEHIYSFQIRSIFSELIYRHVEEVHLKQSTHRYDHEPFEHKQP